jgi:hypothetical protein
MEDASIMKRTIPMTLAAALCAVGVVACGGSSSKPTSTEPVAETNLNPVMFRGLENAPTVSVSLKRQNGTDIQNVTVRFGWSFVFDNIYPVTHARSAKTSATGTASLALPAGTYPLSVSLSGLTDPVGDLVDSITVSTDKAVTYQTSQQNWTVTSTAQFSELAVDIYAVDAAGKINWGTSQTPLDAQVLSATFVQAGPVTSASFTTELFKGTYKALIRAKATGSGVIHPFFSPVITAAGAGATEQQTVALPAGGNVVSLAIKEGATPAAAGAYRAAIYDRGSRLYIDEDTTDLDGAVAVAVGTFTDVVALVYREGAGGSRFAAARTYTASPTMTATLTRYTVSGSVKPPAGGTLQTQTDALVVATPALGTGDAYFDQTLVEPITASLSSDGLDTFSIDLFEGSYSVVAANVTGFPDATTVAVAVSADKAGVELPVAAGGVVTGRVQNEANADLQGITVTLDDATTHARVARVKTAANGTYTMAVPYGTYDLRANGSLTRGLAVTAASATVTKNLTQLRLSGRLRDAVGSGLAGTVEWAGGTKQADTLGTFQIDVVEGLNYFVFTPPADKPSIGFEFSPLVLVDATTKLSDQ